MSKTSEKTLKQPYSPPTITDHGDVIKQTQGVAGRFWEYIGTQTGDYPPIRD